MNAQTGPLAVMKEDTVLRTGCLDELEERGLIDRELCFGLILRGRERLGEAFAEGARVAGWAA